MSSSSSDLRSQVVSFLKNLQDEICASIDGFEARMGSEVRFTEDLWSREGGEEGAQESSAMVV